MTWERFGYICRKASATCKADETVSTVLSKVVDEKACELYGKAPAKNAWSNKILKGLASLSDEDARQALSTYKELNLSDQFEEPMRFKRVVAYLSYITFVFFSVVSTYQVYVFPVFDAVFADFDISDRTYFSGYQDYWTYFTLVTGIVLILSLFIGHRLKSLFKFRVGVENSLVFRYLTFSTIRRSYKNVIDILTFPLLEDKQSDKNSLIIEHLKIIESSKLSLSTEMNELLQMEMRRLLESSEKQMKLITVVTALVVIASVFFFLASAYSPIFLLGDAV